MNTYTNIEQKVEDQLVKARKQNVQRLSDIEHRLEFVAEVNGVEYVNDAKAADMNSTWYSIDCMEKPIIWIVSSSNYDEDYELMGEIDQSGIKAVVILGANPEKVKERLSQVQQLEVAQDVHEAVRIGMRIAQEGEVVLYSPACTDLKVYTPYKENGQRFRKAVREVQL